MMDGASLPDTSEATALEKVFNTLELFERILTLADPTCAELARARRVCRQFRASIDGSSIFQKNLYLEARVEGSIWAKHGGIFATGPTAKLYLADYEAKEMVVHELHPALEVHRQIKYAGIGRYLLEKSLRQPQVHFINNNCITKVPHDSALLDMFLSQPPTKKVYVKIKGLQCEKTHGHTHGFELASDAGIKFWLLLKAVRKCLNNHSCPNNYKDNEACVDYMDFGSGEPFTTKQKLALEEIGETRVYNDPSISDAENKLRRIQLRWMLSKASSAVQY
jgi:hypothetical protein